MTAATHISAYRPSPAPAAGAVVRAAGKPVLSGHLDGRSIDP